MTETEAEQVIAETVNPLAMAYAYEDLILVAQAAYNKGWDAAILQVVKKQLDNF